MNLARIIQLLQLVHAAQLVHARVSNINCWLPQIVLVCGRWHAKYIVMFLVDWKPSLVYSTQLRLIWPIL